MNKYKIPKSDKNTIFAKTDEKLWKIANYFIIFLIFSSIIIAYISTLPFMKNYNIYFFVIDFFISTVFLFEYFYRLSKAKNKKVFILDFLNTLDFLSFAPFFILALIYKIWVFPMFVLFRLFRIFRIIEFFEKMPISKMFFMWLKKHKIEIISGLFFLIFILIIFSSLLYVIEFHFWNSDFDSLAKATWWWIYALTTSWDAWIIPETFVWRFLAWILMTIWPILISIISSIIVVIFLDATNVIDLKWKSYCKKCNSKIDKDSKYCSYCGVKI